MMSLLAARSANCGRMARSGHAKALQVWALTTPAAEAAAAALERHLQLQRLVFEMSLGCETSARWRRALRHQHALETCARSSI